MKKITFIILIFLINICFTSYYFYLKRNNHAAQTEVQPLQNLQQKYAYLKQKHSLLCFPWQTQTKEESKSFLEKQLSDLQIFILKDHCLTPASPTLAQKFNRPKINLHNGYLSGFILYKDCIFLLEKLSQLELPLWITSMTIQRNFYHNLGLQVSFTYTLTEVAN